MTKKKEEKEVKNCSQHSRENLKFMKISRAFYLVDYTDHKYFGVLLYL